MIIFKAIYSFMFFPYMIAALILNAYWLYFVSIFKKDRQEFLFRGSRFWAKRLIIPTIAQLKVRGLENIPKGKPVVFISNHQSYFDIPVILASIPGSFRFIVKKEFGSFPVFGRFTKASGHLFVDREVGHEAHKTLLQAVDLIHKGKSIIIFPEGTRTRDGKLGVFKRGGLTIAFETGAPIIPVAISGTYNIMRRNNPALWPSKVVVSIGKPIHIKDEEKNREMYTKTMASIKEEIQKMMAP